jgi:hypothetical protein
MKQVSDQVIDSPFDEVSRITLEFALNLHEDILFKRLYAEPSTREAAIDYLITSPKIKYQRPN